MRVTLINDPSLLPDLRRLLRRWWHRSYTAAPVRSGRDESRPHNRPTVVGRAPRGADRDGRVDERANQPVPQADLHHQHARRPLRAHRARAGEYFVDHRHPQEGVGRGRHRRVRVSKGPSAGNNDNTEQQGGAAYWSRQLPASGTIVVAVTSGTHGRNAFFDRSTIQSDGCELAATSRSRLEPARRMM
jgi:hypothetical protein